MNESGREAGLFIDEFSRGSTGIVPGGVAWEVQGRPYPRNRK